MTYHNISMKLNTLKELYIYLLNYNSIIYDETKIYNDHKILDKTNILDNGT